MMGTMTDKKENRTNKALMAIAGLLLLTTAFLGFKLVNNYRLIEAQQLAVDDVTKERENVQVLLEATLDEYDELNITNDTLSAEIAAQKAQIEDLLVKVKKNKDLSWLLSKARKEAKTLRSIMKGYVITIDSLNQANQLLMAENVNMTQELGEVKGQKQALESRTSELEGKLEMGSVLHVLSMSANAVYLRNNGKQVETSKARKAQMVKSCFTVGANNTTDAGQRIMHIRIISPDGTVLPASEPNSRFEFNGVQGVYSAKRTIDYVNNSMEVCIFWTAEKEMTSGEYTVEVYDRGQMIEKAAFVLK